MLSGRVYIDEKDIYAEYGVYINEDKLSSLVAYPKMKELPTNDWQEEDGIEVDLSSPKLDSKEVSLTFIVPSVEARMKYSKLINLLSLGAYHTFKFANLGDREYILRLTSNSSIIYKQYIGEEVLKFADDFPLKNISYSDLSSEVIDEGFSFDDKPLTAYGVHILQGTIKNIVTTPSIKQAMYRNLSSQNGAIYDDLTDIKASYKDKDIQLNCFIKADDITQMWQFYDTFLYQLVRPEEHHLYISEFNKEFSCYYKSCSVTEFFTDSCWIKFTITLTLLNNLLLEFKEMKALPIRMVNSAMRLTTAKTIRF